MDDSEGIALAALGRGVTRRWDRWLTWLVFALAGGVLGLAAGVNIAERPATYLSYCSVEQGTSLHPCPPDTSRWVEAEWSNVTTVARWTGSWWEFGGIILGQRTTTSPALAWRELEAQP